MLSHSFMNLTRGGNNMFKQPETIQFSLPNWLLDFAKDISIIKDVEDRMNFVIESSHKNVKENTGGPFAAAIFELGSGKLISLGVNLVTTQGSSILHAEMVAIAIAQKKLGTYDLGGESIAKHELVTSTEPCAMCFGAIPWSGVHQIVTGAKDKDARSIGFDEGPKVKDWREALAVRKIAVISDIEGDKARQVLDEYSKSGKKIYNSREAS